MRIRHPDAIAALDRVSDDQVGAVAAAIGEPAVARVGPHTAAQVRLSDGEAG